ncbi:hypothetical protein [Paractinoplanes lichenicola]|uniref:DUF4190 domain-containing protein n=1 Tax=Paractinoplanes lichenicola TaxID=2802976 RepID=A0ABS1VLV0_9ACTN|nr:hypothetical protein [Actinoplanes lichenicola]MBL7255700.1 hypothetical protein [Actinoplanes lichenicola]
MTAEPRTSQTWLSPSTPAAARQVHQAPLQGGSQGLAARYQAAERPVARPLFGPPPTPAYPARQAPQGDLFAAPGMLPPSVWPVAVWTFLFGPLAIISVLARGNKAGRMGLSTTPYWMAFGITTAVTYALGCALYMVVVVALGLYTL